MSTSLSQLLKNAIPKRVSSSRKSMQEQAVEMLARYPDRVPIFLERGKGCSNVPEVKKNKYLAPRTITVAEFQSVVRQRMKLDAGVAMFMMVGIGKEGGGCLMPSSMLIGEAYDTFRFEDSFLHITYTGENTFG